MTGMCTYTIFILEKRRGSLRPLVYRASRQFLAIKSADNQFVLEVPKGAAQGSVRVKIEAVSNLSSERLIRNYQLISNIYRIKVENESINGSSIIHFNEALLGGSSLDRNKMVIQRLAQDPLNWTIVRNKFNGKGLLASVQDPQFGDFVLAYSTNEFDDVIGHWSQEKIEALVSQELVSGYNDRQFQPDQPITRAEFTKMIETALDLPIEKTEKAPFSDTLGHWVEPFVRTAFQEGIVFGEGIYFRPDHFITRQEMMAILARVLDEHVEVTNPVGNLKAMFQDEDEIEEWSRPSIQKVVELGFIHGKDGRIAPMERTTRAEAATVLFQMIEQL